MESRYFKRDISWLSFNYRVLLEAEDDTLPLYERINFISIYSSLCAAPVAMALWSATRIL